MVSQDEQYRFNPDASLTLSSLISILTVAQARKYCSILHSIMEWKGSGHVSMREYPNFRRHIFPPSTQSLLQEYTGGTKDRVMPPSC